MMGRRLVSLSCQALGDDDAVQHAEGDDEMAGEDAELDEETKARLDLLLSSCLHNALWFICE